MGAAVLVNSGESQFLDVCLGQRLFLRLYNTDQEVTWYSLLSDFSPAINLGFEDQEITGLWPGARIDGTGQAYSQLPTVTWTRGAGGLPETIYGWLMYMQPMPDGVLVCGDLFTMPISTSMPGDVVYLNLMSYLLRA